jgi:hypothetical protein
MKHPLLRLVFISLLAAQAAHQWALQHLLAMNRNPFCQGRRKGHVYRRQGHV